MRTAPLGVALSDGWTTLLAVASDGTAVILLAEESSAAAGTRSHVRLIAVEPSGAIRWDVSRDITMPFDPFQSEHYGLFVDAAGTLVATAGTVDGVDLETGATLCSLRPPKPSVCLRPAVLGPGATIIASQSDGTIFLASDR